ncbi:MAG: permease-like cell division protein FtsX [Selenomonadaceae bacterium]|nr:permease-like cell division protein FtsX [Selenomonadaceae bacterium]
MKLQTVEYYIREVIISMIRNRWMGFASIGTVAVSLFILGVFFILVTNMTKMASSLESQIQISAYLNDALTEEGRNEVEKMIKDMRSVSSVEYVPKEKALEILQDRLGEQKKILDALGDSNPLPNAFTVTVKSAGDVKKTAAAVADLYGVEEVKYGQDVAANLFDLTHLIRVFGFLLMLLLTCATIFIISNTIRLTVFARRKEIAIMKYVGATDWFIRWPFILEGMFLGFIGGSISALALRSFYKAMLAKIASTLAFFPVVSQLPFINYVTVGIIVAGIFIGILGSTVSLKKFMEV